MKKLKELKFDLDREKCWEKIEFLIYFYVAEWINWAALCYRKKLSENFIREFQHYVVWDNISSQQTLSEDFIREFEDRVNWTMILASQKLSEEFINEFKNKRRRLKYG